MEAAQMRRSVTEAFWAMCAADSMSMPVHWYYDIDDIRRDFGGWISELKPPRDRHPSSILTLSNTSRTAAGAGWHGNQGPRDRCQGLSFSSRQRSDGPVHRHQTTGRGREHHPP